MLKEPNVEPSVMSIYFKNGTSVEYCEVPAQIIDDSGKFLFYWENNDLKGVNIDTVDRFIFKNVYKEE